MYRMVGKGSDFMTVVEDITNELKTVFDPEIGVNVVDLGLVYEIQEKENNEIYIKMTLTSPACPMGPQIMEEVRQKLGNMGLKANVELTFNPPWGPDKMSEDGKFEL